MSKEKQKTAVEWLVKELNSKLLYIPLSKWDDISNLVEQAKEMEKQQIMNAVKDSWNMAKTSNFQYPQEDQYYNEKYGK